MQHLSLKATTVSTEEELGQFEALVSAWTADREKDVIEPNAFNQSISDWQASGKRLPLLFEHTTTAVGWLDPASMSTDERGLIVSGEVDRETPEGAQAWKQIKNGSASFSIGFMATESRPRKGGGRDLLVIDLLEVSVVSKPMHPATRTLSWKTADPTSTDEGTDFFNYEAKRKHDEEFRERFRRKRRDQELAEMVAEITARTEKEEAKAARAARPIKIKTFKC